AEPGALRLQGIDTKKKIPEIKEGMSIPVGTTPSGRAFTTRRPFVANTVAEMRGQGEDFGRRFVEVGFRSCCCVPMVSHDRALGTLNAASERDGVFDAKTVALMQQVAAQLTPAVDNALAYREIARLRDRLQEEKRYLERELAQSFDEI